MDTKNKSDEKLSLQRKTLAFASFCLSLVLGISFVVLFCWKAPGVSVVIFYIIASLISVLPVVLIESSESRNRFTKYLILLPLVVGLSLIFLYRLNEAVVYFAFITLPTVFATVLVSIFFEDALKNFGLLTLLKMPFLLLVSWFGDMVKFFKHLSIPTIKSARNSEIVGNIIKGALVGIPFFIIFALLLSSADQVFSKALTDFFRDTFGSWFKDFNATISTIFRIIIGMIVALYSAVFNFSLWNKESIIGRFVKAGEAKEEGKKSWNPITWSTFLFMLNLLFVSFVAVQFVYLFGGESNIIGKNSNFTYAEYARRGFGELVVVAIFAYLIILLLNLKVYANSLKQKVVFKGNLVVMMLALLVVTFSAYRRMWLYEETYGFTQLRVIVQYAIVMIALMYVFLLISAFVQKSSRLISASTAGLALISYVVLLVFPLDLFVANLNIKRYEKSGLIDIPYLIKLSDEAVPALVDLSQNSNLSQTGKNIINAKLQEKYNKIKDHNAWQSYNFWNEKNKNQMEPIVSGNKNWVTQSENELTAFLNSYSTDMVNGNYDEAYKSSWSKNTTELDLSKLNRIKIKEFNYEYIPAFADWNFVDFSNNSPYWNGMEIRANVKYEFTDSKGRLVVGRCVLETLRVKVEDGKWKIVTADQFVLGNFKDKGNSRYYNEKSNFDHLYNNSLSADSCYVTYEAN